MESFLGFIVGLCVMSLIAEMLPPKEVIEYKTAIEQCEKELPRNQTCEIFAKAVLINRQ